MGWHNANEIWNSVFNCYRRCLHRAVKPNQIEVIGITNQRETTVVGDKNTGLLLSTMLSFSTRQTAPLAEQLKSY